MAADLSLTVEQLEEFFQENLDQVVGDPGIETECPIAHYFLSKRGFLVFVAGDTIEELNGPGSAHRKSQEWETLFVQTFDEDYKGLANIQGCQALSTLIYVKEQIA